MVRIKSGEARSPFPNGSPVRAKPFVKPQRTAQFGQDRSLKTAEQLRIARFYCEAALASLKASRICQMKLHDIALAFGLHTVGRAVSCNGSTNVVISPDKWENWSRINRWIEVQEIKI